jgi:hypothetical protein
MRDQENIQLEFATVTASGLIFQEKVYTNSSMVKYKWFDLAKNHGEWQIPILYRPANSTEIMLFDLQAIEIATSINNNIDINPEELQNYYDTLRKLKKQIAHSIKRET